jgi:hypothetical protein
MTTLYCPVCVGIGFVRSMEEVPCLSARAAEVSTAEAALRATAVELS